MEFIVPSPTTATPSVTPASLVAAFATIPDPRRAASVVYPLPAMLALTVAALLCAQTSVLAIAEWAARQPTDLLEQLGFRDGQTPRQSTLHRLLGKLDTHALAAALRTAFQRPAPHDRGAEGIAIDGKAQRGRLQFEEDRCPVHLLSAFCQEAGVILAAAPIDQGEDKAEAELTVAPTVISQLNWQGRVLTAGTRLRVSLFCQRALCTHVLAAGGDYLLTVKRNQLTLHHALVQIFDPEARPVRQRQEYRTINKGHGRRSEVRHLIAIADPLALPDWPGIAQIFRIERTWREKGEEHHQVRYGITSLPREIGTPERLLQLRRRHWLIENRVHRAKDVNLGEDACLIHAYQGPTVLALLRDATLNLLRLAGHRRIAATIRAHAQYPHAAVALLLQPLTTHA
jgi:predicted transposase YbfD/YdcC